MNISGVEILSETIIYSPSLFGFISIAILFFITAIFFILTLEHKKIIIGFFTICIFIFFITITIMANSTYQTLLNKPYKIEYTIEIIDNNAWKEIGPNYTVKEKVYENKEIYILQGDYVK